MDRHWQAAIEAGDFRRAREMLAGGADVNARDRHGGNALMRGAHAGRLALVQVLLAHGAELDVTGKYGLSALMLAIVGGHESVACRLTDAGADVRIRGTGAPGFSGKSALDLARARALPRVIARLEHACAETPGDPAADAAGGGRGCDVLRVHAAFLRGDLYALRAALPDPAAVPNGPMPDGTGPCLVYALYHSPVAFVRTLLDLGAVLDAPRADGFPPLIAVLSARHDGPLGNEDIEKLTLLLDAGADPDQRGINDHTPLHIAAGRGDRRALELLLEAGADPGLRTRIDEYETPRDIARTRGHDHIAAVLAQWGG